MATRAMLAAVSGLDANQGALSETAANIANVGTIGYKEGQVIFGTLLSEMLSGASAPSRSTSATGVGTTGTGGVNPLAIGSGVRIDAVQTNLDEGTLQNTGNPTDIAITGSGYLVVEHGGSQVYTRDGSLSVDANGNLTTQGGDMILGWEAASTGKINTSTSLVPITIPYGKTIAATPTSDVTVTGNLPAWGGGTTTVPSYTRSTLAYNSVGDEVPVNITFKGAKTADTWKMTAVATTPITKTTVKLMTTIVVKFNANGTIDKVNTKTAGTTGFAVTSTNKLSGTQKIAFDIPPSTADQSMTQYSGSESLVIGTNGHGAGNLSSYTIGSDGIIEGTFSNGKSLAIAQIALASLPNPGGLSNIGNNLLTPTANSGNPSIGAPGTGGRGTLLGGELEESNVTLAAQMTQMITEQEDYQANTKSISTMQAIANTLMQA